MDAENDLKEIEVLPFIHQVGGHSFMLSLDEATVCKAVTSRELSFYRTLPPSLYPFTPGFHGVVRVRTVIDDNDYLRFFASSDELANYVLRPAAKARVRFKRNGSVELLSNDAEFLEEQKSCGINPWVLTCHQQYMDRRNLMTSDPATSTPPPQESEGEFIVLENLVWRFRYPCVLDLKMGTRQYGDSVSLAKKQSKMVKVVSTTSAKLGVRLCGMQVYQTVSGRFLCRNKFFGRSLSVAGLQQALVQYLHNGVRLRTDVLALLIRKLEQLVAIVTNDDDDEDEDDDAIELVQMNNSGSGSLSRRGSDGDLGRNTDHPTSQESLMEGLVKRRTSSAANLELNTPTATSSNSSSNSVFEETKLKSRSNSFRGNRTRSDSFRERCLSSKSDPGGGIGGSPPSPPLVDVRMIDFAHSTHKDLDDLVVYSGPDRGFLFGVETLIGMLKSIEIDYG